MNEWIRLASGLLAVSLMTAAVAAVQKPIAYPAKGQSPEQQSSDDAECYAWAKQSSGVDPVALAGSSSSGSSGGGGERLRGAARGALGGAAIGAIAGDAGTGAGVGAVAGTMVGGHRARQREAAENAQANQDQQALASYYQAYGACMSGRGYSVR